MEIKEAIYERKSIRSFNEKPVSKDVIIKLIDAAQQAPSACNQQLWKFIVVDDKPTRVALTEKAKGSPFFKTAPVTIIVLYKKNIVTNESADIQSAAGAIENLLLMAQSLGLGATWINHFGDEKVIRELLAIPESYRIVSTVVLGHYAGKIKKPARTEPQSLVSFNKFSFSDFAPDNIDPKKWNFDQVLNIRDKTIRQTLPGNSAFPYGTKREFDAEIRFVSEMLESEKEIIEFLPFAGTHTKELVEKLKPKRYVLAEYSDECIYFIEQRLGKHFQKVSQRGSFFDLKGNTKEQLIIMQKLENFNDLSILDNICKSAKEGGKVIVSFSNSRSFFGAHYFIKNKLLRKKVPIVLPFKPLNQGKVAQCLKRNGFSIYSKGGISPFPFKRGLTVRGPLSSFCKIVIFECKTR